MFFKKRTYASASFAPAPQDAAANREDTLWRLADKARRKAATAADASLAGRAQTLGGHADFTRKA